ncbi:MAG: hypothetical protein AABZ65_06270 [Candidatus Omnitrophota bacterium]
MSIIYEALKKTQNSSKSMPAGIIPDTSQKQGLKKAGKFPYMPVLGIIISLGLVFFISVRPRLGKSQKIAESLIIRQPENSLTRSVRLSPLQSEKDQIPSPPFSSQDVLGEVKKPQRRQPDFVVNGIVISPEGNIALVNDQIIKAGDTIEGAKVERIEDSSVVLFDGDREIILKSK